MRFDGSYEELKEKLIQLKAAGQWSILNANQYLFRSNSGAVLNWYANTKNMTFQGHPAAAEELESLVAELLSAAEGPQSRDSAQAAGEAL